MSEQELRNLFNHYTVEFPDSDNIRAIDFTLFKAAAEYLIHDSFTKGVTEGLESMHTAVQSTLKAMTV